MLKVSFGVSFEYRLGYRLERPMKIQNPGCIIYIKHIYIVYIICVGYRLSIVWCIVFHIFYHKVDSSSIFLNIVFSCWPLQKIKRSKAYNTTQYVTNTTRVSCPAQMLSYRFFYIKCLHLTGNLRSGTVDGQNIQTSRKGLDDAPFPKCQS